MEQLRSFARDRGKVRKFWVIARGYRKVIVSAGESGPGEVNVQNFPSDEAARAEYDRQVAGKLAEGFVETTDAPWHGGFESPLRRVLEDALAKDPDDLATHMAYADLLMELGDPRGELVRVQIALEDESLTPARRKALRRQEEALLAHHQRAWLGPMAHFWIDKLDAHDYDHATSELPHQLTWRRGWIDSLWLNDAGLEGCEAALARAPLLRLLRDFRILYAHDDNDAGPDELLKADCFRRVRVFQLGAESEQCYWRGEIDADAFLKQMPNLEEFHCYTPDSEVRISTSQFPPRLRKLTVHHGRDAYPLERLGRRKNLTHLTHLSCWPRGQSNDRPDEPNADGGWAYITRRGAAALFRSRNLPSLRHLTLRNSDIGDEGLGILIDSGMLKRLKTLDLLGGCVTDAGARLLAACPDLRNLESLNLSENLIGPEGLAALRATGVNLTADHQLGPDALETGQYLYSGDSE